MKKNFLTDKQVNEKVTFVINGLTDLCPPMDIICELLILLWLLLQGNSRLV